MASGYTREDDGADPDSRFGDDFNSIESIVTSTAQNDSGLFETNLRDERYLPFEGAGAISSWRLEMPATFRQFDRHDCGHRSAHTLYRARWRNRAEAGVHQRDEQRPECVNAIQHASQSTGLMRLVSIRQEFPSAWAQLIGGPIENGKVSQTLSLTRERFPFLFSSRETALSVSSVDLIAVPKASVTTPAFPSQLSMSLSNTTVTAGQATLMGRLVQRSLSLNPPRNAVSDWIVEVSNTAGGVAAFRNNFDDVLILLHFQVQRVNGP